MTTKNQHTAKTEWTKTERQMVERFGYTGKTATSAVALAREEKESYNTELADARADAKCGHLSLGSGDNL